MGIEDPGWGKIIIVIFFITILLGFLYFSKLKGKNFLSQLSNNEFLNINETIAISNISKASIVTAYNSKFLIVHGKGQQASITPLPFKKNRMGFLIKALKMIRKITHNMN